MFTFMTAFFCAYLDAANAMSYDTQQYYNTALAIIAGSAVAALSFRLAPPLSPAYRTRRLLARTLRDLRRLAAGRVSWSVEDWQGRLFGRLAAMPEAAAPVQRAELLSALAAGAEIIRLRGVGASLGAGSAFEPALAALAQGKSAVATAQLSLVGALLHPRPGAGVEAEASLALKARASILAITCGLSEHASYFDGEDRA
ncbi:MAG TPA: FUSC family protein, partial [Methylocystis sp.]|nr:FUSC family protein [Methylocystis sp.]